jgi:predicted O-methyltransferase YrrM
MNNLPNYFNQASFNFSGLKKILESKKDLQFLQIGVYTGDASIFLLQEFSHLENFTLTDVDTWTAGDSEEMHELDFQEIEKIYFNRTKYEQKIGKCIQKKMTSDLFFAGNQEKFDFVYIDGNHESIQLLKDALNAIKCVEEGGIVAFDDYLGAEDKPLGQRPKFVLDLFLTLMEGKVEIVINNYQLWVRKVSSF